MTIIAAADGSALGNPGPAGWGWYVDPSCWASGGWPHGTNNMGELTAVLDLLQQTAEVEEDLEVLCDSKYAIDTITKWMAGWKKKGWKKADGKPVANLEIVQALDVAMRERRGNVSFTWVKGHAGHTLNEEADRIANAASLAFKEGRTPDPGPGWSGGSDRADDAADDTADEAADDLPHEPAPEPEPSLDEEPALDPVEAAWAAERALLSDDVRSDRAALEALLHPGWTLLADRGRLWRREEWLDRAGPAGDVEIEAVESTVVADGTVLLVWRGRDRLGSALHATWWVREGSRWLQRFHHVSRTSD
ncbi:DUF4440 domain-containing protein [Nocardioides sp. Y6]|uniref:ribonuclease H n=1 Tax=Nocardioides malaquae TaxID=2773426 RepID=A0ABR9RT24_9ACTN|nr:DUF4440 domain-containing protein [Nocardioides malaquae]